MAVCASIAVAAPLTAAAANAVLHWRRLRPRAPTNATGARRNSTPQLSVRAFLDELFATLLAFAAPISALCPQRRAAADTARPIVVILHEPLLAAASWLLVRRLRGEGWRVLTHTTRARPLDAADVDAVAGTIRAMIGNHTQPPLDPSATVLVAIGGCGLLARQLGARDRSFGRVMTIATPHGGNAGPLATASVRPGAAYIEVVAAMDPTPRSFDAVAVYSDGDGWIEPREAAYYPGAFNLEVHDLGRLSMLFSRRVFAYVTENLVAPPPRRLG